MNGELYPLHMAASEGDIERVRELLDAGAKPDAPGEYGSTALHLAAMNGHEKVVRLLLEYGADPDAEGRGAHTPLRSAAHFGHKNVVRALIEAGARVELLEAAATGETGVLRRLLVEGADPNEHNASGVTPVFEAARNGHADAARALLAAGGDPNVLTSRGFTPLMVALMNGHKEVAEVLLRAGADVRQCGPSGNTALHMAVLGYVTGRYVARGRAHRHARRPVRRFHRPRLSEAAHRRRLPCPEEELRDLIRALAVRGANLNAKGDRGITPLWWVQSFGDHRTASLLRSLGAYD